jgi:probable rRNA maturation factor
MILVRVDDSFIPQVDPDRLERAANLTLQHQALSKEVDLSIVITDNEQIQVLNRQFRRIDSPTDVLSFPAGFTDPDSQRLYIGDVIISFPQAQTQALSANHHVSQELSLLVVHGVLHLLGQDHTNANEKKKMWEAQSEILENLGIHDIRIQDT